MIIGGGGTAAPSNQLLLDPARCEVITQISDQPETPSGSPRAKRVPVKEAEDATWVGTRDKNHAWGFASFDVDPGQPGGMTRIFVRVWDTAPSATGTPTMFDQFTLQRPRRDTSAQRAGAAM